MIVLEYILHTYITGVIFNLLLIILGMIKAFIDSKRKVQINFNLPDREDLKEMSIFVIGSWIFYLFESEKLF